MYWKNNLGRWKELSTAAILSLSVPSSSAEVERSFFCIFKNRNEAENDDVGQLPAHLQHVALQLYSLRTLCEQFQFPSQLFYLFGAVVYNYILNCCIAVVD